MSLLEDVFLEDEAGEAQELERVIEGDEFDDRPRYESGNDSNENSEKEDEAEEDKRRVDPATTKTKKVVKHPRFILNPARLTGPRGIHVIPDHFKDFKFKGKGHEKEDLDLVLKKLEHWAYRLYPKFKFDDCLKKIEMLGRKRPVMVHLQKIRSDQFMSEETVVQRDSSDDEPSSPAPEDEFDKLLQQQIELARSTPAPNSVKKQAFTPTFNNRSPLTMPKAISSPSISDEQKERIIRNRKLAEERRLARLKNISTSIDLTTDNVINNVENHVGRDEPNMNKSIDLTNSETVINEVPISVEDHVPIDNDEPKAKKQNKSNVINSSDDECEEIAVNHSITVDVHGIHKDVEMHSNKDEDDIRDTNKTDNTDLDIDDISEQVSESDNRNSENVINSLNNVINTNRTDNNVNKELNTTSKEREVIDYDAGSEVTAFDKCENDIKDISENRNNITESVKTGNVTNENVDNLPNASNVPLVNRIDSTTQNEIIGETSDFDSVKMNLGDSIIEDSNRQLDGGNASARSNRTEDVFHKSNDFEDVNKVVNVEKSTDNSNPCSDNSVHNDNAEDTGTSYNNKEHIHTPVNNKENIDNNVQLDLMDVDFSEDF